MYVNGLASSVFVHISESLKSWHFNVWHFIWMKLNLCAISASTIYCKNILCKYICRNYYCIFGGEGSNICIRFIMVIHWNMAPSHYYRHLLWWNSESLFSAIILPWFSRLRCFCWRWLADLITSRNQSGIVLSPLPRWLPGDLDRSVINSGDEAVIFRLYHELESVLWIRQSAAHAKCSTTKHPRT